MPKLAFIIIALFLSTSYLAEANTTLHNSGSHAIAFIGDTARADVRKTCLQSNICAPYSPEEILAPPADADIFQIADAIHHAKHAVMIVNAFDGAMPVTRDHILLARQANIPSLSVWFYNSEGIISPELLAHIEWEIKSLFDEYEMADGLKLYHGEEGLKALIQASTTLPARKKENFRPSFGRYLHGYAYHLGDDEIAGGNIVLQKGDKITIWFAGQHHDGELLAPEKIVQGDDAEILLKLDTSVKAIAGTRFIFVHNGLMRSAGVIIDVSRKMPAIPYRY